MRKQKKIPVVIRVNKGTGQIIVIYPEQGKVPGRCKVDVEVKSTALIGDTGNYDRLMESTKPASPEQVARIVKKIKEDKDDDVCVKTRWGIPKKAVSGVR